MLLYAENLTKHFAPRQGASERLQATLTQSRATKQPLKTVWQLNSEPVRAVEGVSLSIAPGEIVGLVGESGSGKTTVGRLLVRLIPPTAGKIIFDEKQITTLNRRQMRPLRRSLRMMFQKPAETLNPLLTIQQILMETIEMHPDANGADKTKRLHVLQEMVNLPENVRNQYPGELSGGLLRRVAIARTLVGQPKLIIADEPVAGLDVSIQAQIINLMKRINEEQGVAYLCISHNLKVVQHISSRILVMYCGRIVEEGRTDEVSQNPLHPYTADLLRSANYDLAAMQTVRSTAPTTTNPNGGCPYRFDGCPIYESINPVLRRRCETERPELTVIPKHTVTHKAACHHLSEGDGI